MNPRVILYTRPGCHLCDGARDIVTDVCAEQGVAWGEVDIDGDPALTAEHGERVPVITIDGQLHTFWRVNPDRLRAELKAASGTQPRRGRARRARRRQ